MSTAGVTEESGQCAVLWLSGICLQLEWLKNQVSVQCAVLWLSGICLQLEWLKNQVSVQCCGCQVYVYSWSDWRIRSVCSVVVVRYMSTAGVTKESGQCAVLWLSGIYWRIRSCSVQCCGYQVYVYSWSDWSFFLLFLLLYLQVFMSMDRCGHYQTLFTITFIIIAIITILIMM